MAIPIFTSGSDTGKSAGDSVADRTEYYTTAKNLLTSGADAMERLMTAYKVENVFLNPPQVYLCDVSIDTCKVLLNRTHVLLNGTHSPKLAKTAT